MFYGLFLTRLIVHTIKKHFSEKPNVTLITNDLPCYKNHFDDFSRLSVYRICVALFACFCFPMVLMGMTKTKYIQLATTVSRWTGLIKCL